MKCPLCSSPSSQIMNKLMRCSNCDLVFKVDLLTSEEERDRYLTHNNDISDTGYLNYLENTLKKAEVFFTSDEPKIFLDYGCGPTKGLEAVVLKTKRPDRVVSYDPYFFREESLTEQFDLVFASECFEHFNNPLEAISDVVTRIKNKGILCVSTHLHHEETHFESWWYLNDPTHVSFFSEKTFLYLADQFKLDILDLKSPHVVLRKRLNSERSL